MSEYDKLKKQLEDEKLKKIQVSVAVRWEITNGKWYQTC